MANDDTPRKRHLRFLPEHPLHLCSVPTIIANASAGSASLDANRGRSNASAGASSFVRPTMAKDSNPSEPASLRDPSPDTSG